MSSMQASGDPSVHSMNNYLQTYSALQCLLFFQSLAAHRPDSNAFVQVAQSLRDSTLFKEGLNGVDDPRLGVEALSSLYDRTLSASKAGAQSGEGNKVTSDVASSDTSGAQAAEVIPQLYEDYKRRIIKDIKADEQKYEQLVADIKSLQPAIEETALEEQRTTSPAIPPSIQTPDLPTLKEDEGQTMEHTTSKSAIEEKPPTQQKTHPRRANASIDSIINHDEPSDEKFPRPSTAGSGAMPTPTFPHPDLPYAPPSTQRHVSSIPPASPMRRDSRSSHDMRQAPSPRPGPPLSNIQSRSPTTPVILPPPPGMHPPPLPPTSPYSPHADSSMSSAYRHHGSHYGGYSYQAQDTYGATRYAEPYPSNQYLQREPHRFAQGNQAHPRQMPSQYPPHSPTYPMAPQHQQAQRGGIVLPPFQVTPQVATASQPSQQMRPIAAQQSVPSSSKRIPEKLHLHKNGNVSTPVRTSSTSFARSTPLSTPHTAYLRTSGVIASPGGSTVWRAAPNARHREFSRPRSVSPISDNEATPVPGKPVASGRGRKSKAGKAADQKTAPMNVHNRSQSVSSHVSESVSSSRTGKGGRRVKNEPPSELAAKTVDTNEVDGAKPMPQAKRAHSVKRKRAGSQAEDATVADASATETVPAAMQAPDTVVAYRNFGKMAQPVMNVISSHKHASIFAEPVRERQAEGYRDIIKRPQDLKSIRAAIAAGSRAVAAAVDAQQTSPGSTTGSANTNAVSLPVSESLIPPKGIVNAAQLEQEVMRMFANAVMFNPGDEEIVQDSREMFDSVEQALQQWRDVERMGETEETSKDDDEGLPGSSKRRRT